jgi:hypothetical protein
MTSYIAQGELYPYINRPPVDEQLSVSQEGTCFVKVKIELKLFLFYT